VPGTRDDPIVHQFEEAREAQIGSDYHHAEQKRDGIEVDGAVSLVERDDA
jgi:hypothetical protein